MPNVIISDSICPILLIKIEKLHILEELYGNVLITPEVSEEIGEPLPDWIKIQKARDLKYQALIAATLDIGESSAIALASEYEAPLLILDDLKARNFVKSLGVPYTGTVGVLLNARKNGIIENMGEIIALIERTDFRLSKELKDLALRLAGERDV